MKLSIEILDSPQTQRLQELATMLNSLEENHAKQSIQSEMLAILSQECEIQHIELEKRTKAYPRVNGPLIIQGIHELIDENATVLKESERSSFCRCGSSASMPYCDGSHNRIGFMG